MDAPSKPSPSSPPTNPSFRGRATAPPPPKPTKYRSMSAIMRRSKRVDLEGKEHYGNLLCQVCRSGERGAEMILCDRCDSGYHLHCLRPALPSVPTGSWFCSRCSVDMRLQGFGGSISHDRIGTM